MLWPSRPTGCLPRSFRYCTAASTSSACILEHCQGSQAAILGKVQSSKECYLAYLFIIVCILERPLAVFVSAVIEAQGAEIFSSKRLGKRRQMKAILVTAQSMRQNDNLLHCDHATACCKTADNPSPVRPHHNNRCTLEPVSVRTPASFCLALFVKVTPASVSVMLAARAAVLLCGLARRLLGCDLEVYRRPAGVQL